VTLKRLLWATLSLALMAYLLWAATLGLKAQMSGKMKEPASVLDLFVVVPGMIVIMIGVLFIGVAPIALLIWAVKKAFEEQDPIELMISRRKRKS